MNEELIYKEIINPELLQSMEIEVEIHKLKNFDSSFRSQSISIPHSQVYHKGTGDYLDDLLLGRQSPEIRDRFVKDYTRGGKDRVEFEDLNADIKEKTQNVVSDATDKLSHGVTQIKETIRGVFNMGKDFLNS